MGLRKERCAILAVLLSWHLCFSEPVGTASALQFWLKLGVAVPLAKTLIILHEAEHDNQEGISETEGS